MPSRHQAPNGYRGNARWWVVLACCLCVSAAGCAQQHVHASAPVTTAPIPAPSEAERPMTIAPDTDATPPVEAPSAPPQVALESAPPPDSIPAARAPRKPVEQPVTEASAEPPARPPRPTFLRSFRPSIRPATSARRMTMFPSRQKICKPPRASSSTPLSRTLPARFAASSAQSLDASKSGDWSRAQNLAQKARLLSTELINSF